MNVTIYYDDVAYDYYGFLMLACCFLLLIVVGWYASLNDDWYMCCLFLLICGEIEDDDWLYMFLNTCIEAWMIFDMHYFSAM